MSFSVKTPDDSPGFLLWQLTCQWQREQRSALAKLNLTHPQFVVLACLLWLSTHETTLINQQKISEFSKIDKMSVSTLLTTLERKNLISRTPFQNDIRAYSIKLTSKGEEKAKRAIPIVEKIDQQFFSRETTKLNLLFKALQ